MEQTEIYIFMSITVLLLIIVFIAVISFTIQYKQRKIKTENEKREATIEYQKKLLQAQIEIQQQTMQQIGREIHDNVGQKLTLASLYTQQLEFSNQYPVINEQLLAIGNVINESLTELRSLSKSLTDSQILNVSIQQLIQNECKKIDATGTCKTVFNSNEQDITLNPSAKNIVLRIIQEFMQNSLKHSQCSLISIQLHTATEGVILLLKDDGKGFDTSISSKGIGIQNIHKRAAMLHATLTLSSELNKGTLLELFIPTTLAK